jgi:predicted Fe-S protein YdhL (DUF1289 family)
MTKCILECLLNENKDECISCGRTLEEIRIEGLKQKEEANEQRQVILSAPYRGV